MRRETVMHFFRLLPRFNERKRAKADDWRIDGKTLTMNFKRFDGKLDGHLRTLVRGYFQDDWPERIGTYDVASFWHRFETLQRTLSVKSFMWLLARNFSWNKRSWEKRKKHSLPYIVHYDGRMIIWNGTHRATLCYMFKKRLLARRIDLDPYIKHVNRYGHGKRKRKHS